jgi:hypothetical protein
MVPRSLAASRIWSEGGYAAVSGMMGQCLLDALKADLRTRAHWDSALSYRFPIAQRTEAAAPLALCGPRHAGRCTGLHASRQLTNDVGQICGIAVSSTGVGTYHFYEREGDFFALHHNFVGCDIAVITCILQRLMEQPMGELLVYPNFFCQGLSRVRAAGKAMSVSIPLVPGETAILLGGQLPHEVTPVAAGQDRVVAVNCYRLNET